MKLYFLFKKHFISILVFIGCSVIFIYIIKQNIILKRSLSCNSSNIDVQELGFSGNIKSIHEIEYGVSRLYGMTFRGRNKGTSIEYYFNKDGNYASIIRSDNTIDIFSYDSNGNKQKEEKYSRDKNGLIENKPIEISEYDENGQLLSYVRNIKDSPIEIFEYNKYDKHGRIIEKRRGAVRNKVSWSDYDWNYKFEYDSDGDKITETVFNNEDNTLISKTNFKYNDKKNLIEENEYNYVNTSSWRKTLYKYNHHMGALVNKIDHDLYFKPPISNSITVYTYNPDGNLFQIDCYKVSDDAVYRKLYTKTYDIHGNIIHEIHCDLLYGDFSYELIRKYDGLDKLREELKITNEGIIKTVYKYSKQENGWLIKKIYYNGELESIIKRKLKYY